MKEVRSKVIMEGKKKKEKNKNKMKRMKSTDVRYFEKTYKQGNINIRI